MDNIQMNEVNVLDTGVSKDPRLPLGIACAGAVCGGGCGGAGCVGGAGGIICGGAAGGGACGIGC